MISTIVNDARLICKECGSTEARVAPIKELKEVFTGSICVGCGAYTELSLDEFDLFEKELTES